MLRKSNLVIASFACAILISGLSSLMAQDGRATMAVQSDRIEAVADTDRKVPTLGCCKCLGGSNTLDLSTVSSNNWTVNGNPAVIQASPNSAWNLPTGAAHWVSTVANGSSSNLAGGFYDYRLTFFVPNCTIGQSVTLKGSYGGDNNVQVFLDNASGLLSSCSGGLCFSTSNQPTPFTQTNITTGVFHTLIVKVNNFSGPSGMFVNAQLTSACSSAPTK